MRTHRKANALPSHPRKGAMLALIAICLPLFLIFAAYSLNVAYMQMTRTELRTATDAASRAGARTLSLRQDTEIANAAAIEAARRNNVAGDSLLLGNGDLQWGLSQPGVGGVWGFVPAGDEDDPRNSLRVVGSRTTGSLSGSIPLLFSEFTSTGVFEPSMSSTATQIDRDICLVLDTSGSMAALTNGAWGDWSFGNPAPAGSKWLALVDSVDAFLNALRRTPQDEQVALVTYSTWATHQLDLTLNYTSVEERMDEITANFEGGSTGIGRGADLGITGVSDPTRARRFAAKTIVILTDGQHNQGRSPDVVALEARDANITVHTIAFGNDANETLMQQTATNGGGKYWKATTPESLTAAFEEIANNLPTLLTE